MVVINLVVVVDFRHGRTQEGQRCVDWCIFRYFAFVMTASKFGSLVIDVGDNYCHF